jgi:hypothetical protein
MPAILKVYTDNAHSSEVAHTAQNSTTLNNGGTLSSGAVSLTLTSVTGWPTSGMLDIDTAGNLETIPYFGLSGSVVQLAKATGINHSNGVAVVQWYYQLAVGDQTNGIANDGTNATPNGATNVGTWYVYNAGDQTATSPTFATSASSPSTSQGYSDTVISITSISSGFATSVSPSNISAGSQQQIWVCAEIPNAQNPAGTNPQICLINLSYNSI